MNILVFAPHPDDDILGCGGSIINHEEKGHSVSIIYMTSGDAGNINLPKSELQQIREAEAKEGAAILGVNDLVFLRLPDGNVRYSQEIVHTLSNIIRAKQPSVIYIPHKLDAHRDHQETYTIVLEAVYRAGASAFQDIGGNPWKVSTILAYEVWTPLTQSTYTEDITKTIDKKMKAMKTHTSQLKNKAYDEAIKGLHRYRGALTGAGIYCECFEVVKISAIF